MALCLASEAAAAEPPFQARARALLGVDQGVYAVAENGTVLAAQHADRPVHPASVTKVPTTLALIRELGPAHRFETTLLSGGGRQDGRLRGDLIVRGGRNPFLVYEDAFLMLLALYDAGVRELAGGVRVDGPFFFNWEPDPRGARFARTLAGRDGAEAWTAVQRWRPAAAPLGRDDVALASHATPAGAGRAGVPVPILRHRSPPLRRIAKELNCYSNNIFHPLAEQIGGARAVERIARASVAPELRAAITITNAAGAGTTNRMSPRAAAALVEALQHELARHGLALPDVLPVAGVDPGTMRDRLPHDGPAVVGKTGTYPSLGVSSLAGVARTRRYGAVTFAILNRGLTVPEARTRQDAFLRAVLEEGGAEPWPYRSDDAPPFVAATVEVLATDGAGSDGSGGH
jgi:D-alanyl-D-alanine carboxypeptidase/D-alanyl-D-alanine-endopeptidase (penicillin-binding protein 4)